MEELCKECHGSGKILTQSIILGRPFMNKDLEYIYPYETFGGWESTICPCKSEEENEV